VPWYTGLSVIVGSAGPVLGIVGLGPRGAVVGAHPTPRFENFDLVLVEAGLVDLRVAHDDFKKTEKNRKGTVELIVTHAVDTWIKEAHAKKSTHA